MGMSYFIMFRNEDEVCVRWMASEELQDALVNDWIGWEFLREIPNDLDGFPSKSVFIIKGEVVIPRQKVVVKEWSIP